MAAPGRSSGPPLPVSAVLHRAGSGADIRRRCRLRGLRVFFLGLLAAEGAPRGPQRPAAATLVVARAIEAEQAARRAAAGNAGREADRGLRGAGGIDAEA